ncbi:hypothetical protein EZV62_003917 [Acer yangbiense]|uniref:Phosphofructokinase domain-containing protein n=1 Tax=Acer yangbiense TaxID=1000413 RepID=A0A5C7IK11_9ROSI|nr:hypothetical protein EZV62_003917 [Acer yangbiense]
MALLTHPKTESETKGTTNINSLCINLEKLPYLTSSSTSPLHPLPLPTSHTSGLVHVYITCGDGMMRGAVKIFDEIRRSKLNVGVLGIPKTVDSDVGIIDRSFGFQTINAAHVEVESGVNGIGLVKLMGRSTRHLALHATLSSRDVDCCLILDNKFYLEGKGGLFQFLEHRLNENGHVVVVVAVSLREHDKI